MTQLRNASVGLVAAALLLTSVMAQAQDATVQGFAYAPPGSTASGSWTNVPGSKQMQLTTNIDKSGSVGFTFPNLGAGMTPKVLKFEIESTDPTLINSSVDYFFNPDTVYSNGYYAIPVPLPKKSNGTYGETVTVDLTKLVQSGSLVTCLGVMVNQTGENIKTTFKNITYGGAPVSEMLNVLNELSGCAGSAS